MKKKLLFILTIITIVCSSLTITNRLNINYWSISIGKKELLSSSLNNKMGDTVLVDLQKIKLIDTLYVEHHLCGYYGLTSNSVTTLTIKNQQNEIIAETISKDDQLAFAGKISLSSVLSSIKTNKGQLLSVWLSIESMEDDIHRTDLLGKLNLK